MASSRSRPVLGSNIVVVPLIGMGLNYTQYGVRLVPVLLGLSLFTILLALVAYMRRARVSKAERFVAGIGVSSEDF